MAKTIEFIDGFNLYHAITQRDEHGRYPYSNYKWLDYWKLIECYLGPQDVLDDVYYFTAYVSWKTADGVEKKKKHQSFVAVQKERGVKVVMGRFRPVWRKCYAVCKRQYQTY